MIETDTSPCSRPGSGARLWNSASETSAAAPPPTPLNSATICGIAVIFTRRAPTAPDALPMSPPTMIRQPMCRCGWASVTPIAIGVTLAHPHLHIGWRIIVGGLIGSASGAVGARRVKMTAMPQMVALFNGVGGGAAALVSLAEFHNLAPEPGRLHGDVSVAIVLSGLIGSVSFAGSMVAFSKLQGLIQGRPITYL